MDNRVDGMGKGVRIYKNVYIEKAELQDECSIGDDTSIVRSRLGKCVIINRRSYVNDSFIGNYTYAGINTTINWAKIGKFCSIGRNVDIGGFNHDYTKVTTMPAFRKEQMFRPKERLGSMEALESGYCNVGNDVWIASGVHVLHNVKIEDGAVIGAGAVVTKDVPAYAIVAGVPAKVIKYRFREDYIRQLLEIKWWDWDDDVIEKNLDWLIGSEVDEDVLAKMKDISEINKFRMG